MNDLIEIVNGQAVTNSRRIAEHFGRTHRDVLDTIRAITTSAEISAGEATLFA